MTIMVGKEQLAYDIHTLLGLSEGRSVGSSGRTGTSYTSNVFAGDEVGGAERRKE